MPAERDLRDLPAGPYPGIRAYTRAEASIFFGRDEQVDGLVSRLQTARFVAVAGESGCGKSSLVRAGLLPALRAGFLDGAAGHWRIADLRPGDQPLRNLACALALALERPGDSDVITAQLRCGPLGVVELLAGSALGTDTELLILVDQFEELIRFRSRLDANEADAFVALLLETVQHEQLAVRIVLTLRTDYLGECAYFRGLPEALNGCQYLVPRLEREQLLDAITSPARVFDGDVDSVLANHMINEVGRSQDQLPVLEHALLWMWSRAAASTRAGDERYEPIVLSMTDYDALGGGLGEALSKHADQVYDALDDQEQRQASRALFCALWDEDAEESDTRRPCTLAEAAAIAGVSEGQLRAIAERFRSSEHSLLMPPPDHELRTDTVLDVGHESLFRHWSRLKEWTRLEAHNAEQYRRWVSLALAWHDEHGDLLSGRNLEAADAWWAACSPTRAWARRYSDGPDDFGVVERFLAESRAAQSRHRREGRRIRIVIVALSVVALGAVLAGIVSMVKTQAAGLRAREVERSALQQRLSAAALNAAQSEPVRGLQLASAAYRMGGDEAEIALRKSIRGSHFRGLVIASAGVFADAAFLPGGHRIVTVGEGDGVAVWDVASGRRLLSLQASPGQRELAVASSGDIAATGGGDGTIDLWDLKGARHLATLAGHVADVTGLAFSPDDQLLASGSADGAATIWSVASRSRVRELVWHLGGVEGVAFTHDGASVATTGRDDYIVLWDVATGKKLRVIGQRPGLGALAFNSTGRFLATIDNAGVRLSDPITDRSEGTLEHTNRVTALAFSPDGARIATTSFDGTLKIWDPVRRVELSRISEEPALHGTVALEPNQPPDGNASLMTHWVRSMSFSADGRQLVTTTFDGTAKIWSVDGGGEIAAFQAHHGQIHRVTYSASGARLATAGADGSVAIWDTEGRQVFRSPRSGPAAGVALDTDGRRVAFSDRNRIAYWDIDANKFIAEFTGATSPIRDLRMFHNDDRIVATTGRRLVVWSPTKKSQVIEVDTGRELIGVAVSPDDRWLASECKDENDEDRKVCLWEASNGARAGVFKVGRGSASDRASGFALPLLDLAFSGDGTWLVTGGKDKNVMIWDTRSRQLTAMLDGHRESVTGVAISPDGTMLASSGDDWVRLWSRDGNLPRDGFPDPDRPAESVAFSPDGRLLVAGGVDGVVRTFAIDAAELLPIATARAPFALDDADRSRYHLAEAPTATQSSNEARWRLRSERSAGAGSLALDEARRFEGARAMLRAREVVGQTFSSAVDKLAPSGEASPSERQQVFRDALRKAAADARSALSALARDAQAIDPGLVFDAAGFADREVERRFLGYAKLATTDANEELAALMLTAGSWSDPLKLAARMHTVHAFHEVARALKGGDLGPALVRLVETELPSEDPRYLPRLRLIALGLKALSEAATAATKKDTFALAAYGFAEDAIGRLDDADAIVDLVPLVASAPARVHAALDKALRLDPTNDRALTLRGAYEVRAGRFGNAVATLRRVSPLSAGYKGAASLAGSIAYDRLNKPDEGYRLMVLAVEGTSSGDWANLAEAAWATGRFVEAILVARRVLDARDVDRADPYVDLAMRFVLVASLVHTGDVANARRELGALVAFAPTVSQQDWSYTGSRTAARRITDAAGRRFVHSLIDYVESCGKKGSPEQLESLLQAVAR